MPSSLSSPVTLTPPHEGMSLGCGGVEGYFTHDPIPFILFTRNRPVSPFGTPVRHTQTRITSSDTAPPRSTDMDPAQRGAEEDGHRSGLPDDAGLSDSQRTESHVAPLPQPPPQPPYSDSRYSTTAHAPPVADGGNYRGHQLPVPAPMSTIMWDHTFDKQQLPPPFTAFSHHVPLQQIPHPHHHYTLLPLPQMAAYPTLIHPSHFQTSTPPLTSANQSPTGHVGPISQGDPSNPEDRPGSVGSTSAPPTSRRSSTERNFPCEECGQKFFRKQDKDRHLVTHSNTKIFACTHPGCTKRFARKDALGRHIKSTIHAGTGKK